MDLPTSPEFTEAQPSDAVPMEGETAPESVTIPAAAATSAGISGAQPGDTFMAKLTVTSNDEMGVGVQISDAMPHAQEEALESEPVEDAYAGPKPKSRTMGPKALGIL